MIVDVDSPKYQYLKQGLCDYCLLRQIIRKQYEHCEQYPNDIKTIRYMYGDYPEYGYGSTEVQRFIMYVEHFLNALIWYPVTKRDITALHRVIYSYGNDSADQYYFKNIKERFDAINSEIIHSLNIYYNFEDDKITYSNYKIPEYFEFALKKALEYSRFDRDKFMNSRLFKSFKTGNYNLSVALDTYDIKMNQEFWDKYTLEDVNEIFTNISNLAGVEKYERGI